MMAVVAIVWENMGVLLMVMVGHWLRFAVGGPRSKKERDDYLEKLFLGLTVCPVMS